MMRLCFGTFAHVLVLCKRDSVTNQQLVGTMTRTIDPACQYISGNPDSVSRLLKCTGNLSPGNIENSGIGPNRKSSNSISQILQLAPKADRTDLVHKFEEHVVCLLDENKKLQAVLALLDIIDKDTFLDDEGPDGKKMSFEKYAGSTKNALLSQSVYDLSVFLAGIFLYTVAAGVKNTVGKDDVHTITSEYINSLKSLRDISFINYSSQSTQAPLSIIATTTPVFEKDNFLTYLTNAGNKYRTIKTFLYNEQPKPFYDFYVCNNITGTSAKVKRILWRKGEVISDANIKKLTDISHFICITGAGGLGKSMMMRHLLLNAIDNYEDFKLIPIFIPLKEFTDTSGKLLDFIYTKVDDLGGGITKTDLENVLTAGLCLLIFDGLDEIGMNYAGYFENELDSFTDRFPSNVYVISSRPNQSFVSFKRYRVLRLLPLSLKQTLQLIDNLDFRPDDPLIKAKFRDELCNNLYNSHQSFAENPLLLTIMLMTFEMYAEVPSQMHIFYREAFYALSKTHDASNGSYKRELKTKLSVDDFAEVFAELCFRTYWDEKSEFNMSELEVYFSKLNNLYAGSFSADDFMYDICYNLCLMYRESGNYYFTHCSFQEYFSAVFLSKQKDSVIGKLGDFFEKRQARIRGDQVFFMLYNMIPDKMNEFIFIPYLEGLFDRCDKGEGYWTFLGEIYPIIEYSLGTENDEEYCHGLPPESFLFSCVLSFFKLPPLSSFYLLDSLPKYDDFIVTQYFLVEDVNEDEEGKVEVMVYPVDGADIPSEYIEAHGKLDTAGCILRAEISKVLSNIDCYKSFIQMLDDDKFMYKIQYNNARICLEDLKARQKSSDAALLDLL